eukprot:scaffold44586_cov48-Phaeocystis_antarctica.AAC.2
MAGFVAAGSAREVAATAMAAVATATAGLVAAGSAREAAATATEAVATATVVRGAERAAEVMVVKTEAVVASVRREGKGHASVRVVEECGAGDVLLRVVAPLRPVTAADNADLPALQSGRGAALLLGELFVCPWVPEKLKAVIKNGAAVVVDAKTHPHAGAMRDSVLSRQLGPSAG